MNRTIHRILATLAALLMLWLAGTGTLIQILDLNSILSDDPPTDPTQLSIAEGMYGQANFVALQLRDFSAEPLPAELELNRAFTTVMQAAPAPEMRSDGLLNPVVWAELRMIDGIPTGQVMMGTQLHAFNALTGAPVAALAHEQLPQGRRLPWSLRQKVKTLHRFWNRDDTPGVYFELLSGIILWVLLITGLVMYFRLLSARAKIGRRELFWVTGGGWWRGLHRVVSVVAAVFLLCIAFSGTWLGFESTYLAMGRSGGGGAAVSAPDPTQPAPIVRERNPMDLIVPLKDTAVQEMSVTTVNAMQRLHPDTPIKAIRLRIFGQMRQGVVIAGGATTRQLVFDADTGEQVSLTERTYPKVGFPFGVQVHEDIKHFHSGALFGIPARLMSLLAGLALLFLSASGLVVYVQMWRKRRTEGRGGLLWR